MAFLDFDPTQQQKMEEKDFSALPAGVYNAAIISSEMKMTRDQSQVFLETVVQILSGPYQNRRLFDKFYINSVNAEDQAKARRKLTTLCEAVGITEAIKESSVLHNKPHNIKVGVGKPTAEYPNPQNFVNYYYPYSDLENDAPGFTGQAGTGGGFGPAPQQQPSPAGVGAGGHYESSAPPWAQ